MPRELFTIRMRYFSLSDVFREVENCVTAPPGFRAGVTVSGIKSDSLIKDLDILGWDVPCVAGGTFTTRTTRAAPIIVCQERLRSGKAQAVIVNSGNANCATGDLGLLNAYRMTEFAAQQLGLENELVLCSSTGIIGHQLPIEKIQAGVQTIELGTDQGNAFPEAIMTTDTHPKRIALEFQIEERTVRLDAETKGAGMTLPNMATMLCYLTTDAAIEQQCLVRELQAGAADSVN